MSEWSGKNVLVTGGASFIGSHLVEDLVAQDANVRVADDLSSGKLKNLKEVEESIEFYKGNLKHLKFANQVVEDIHTVFHLAADHGGRGYIANNPAKCATNMAMSNIVYEAAVENDVDRITFASSACTYPTDIQQEKQLLNEDMISFQERGGAYADEVYGWAKLMGERTLQAYHKQYGIDASIVRIFTAYGPRENETHAIVALMAKAYAEQDPYQIWGDGEQTRNFTYVKDITNALRLASENVSDATPVNAGISNFISINEVSEVIFELLNWEPDDINYMTDKPVGVRHRAADISRANEVLDWEPQYTLQEGIDATLSWYINNHDKEYVRKNLQEILHERD